MQTNRATSIENPDLPSILFGEELLYLFRHHSGYILGDFVDFFLAALLHFVDAAGVGHDDGFDSVLQVNVVNIHGDFPLGPLERQDRQKIF
tara:strand:- start:570 stop:842 length:273 start_codon:yes stop_codon:yes gene_type:complete